MLAGGERDARRSRGRRRRQDGRFERPATAARDGPAGTLSTKRPDGIRASA